jgi:hypothetical protein
MNAFSLVFFIFPALVIAASIIGYLLTRKRIVMPLVTFVVFTILMVTIFNTSFFIWVVLYTLISLAISFSMKQRYLSK